jgi:DNA (cytosine-5)-methyltransferase 1
MNVRAVVMSGKPTVISTFCGTGGSSLGYHWAGFKELLAVDFEDHAVECFKLNFKDVPVWKRSVIDIIGNEIMDFCKIRPGELDVFDGSPPCQGFSTAGKREVRDPRNDLFNHYYRLVTELQPKVFVMENVSGMIKGSMKGRFIEIMNVLKTGNYNVRCKLMNAMYYGVPQSRQRLIFIGVRKDLDKPPVYPCASNKLVTVKEVDQGDRLPCKKCDRYGDVILNRNRQAPTLTKLSRFFYDKGTLYGPKTLLALCSFPTDWQYTKSYTQLTHRLGNAVMPRFMQAVAETIKKEILGVQ